MPELTFTSEEEQLAALNNLDETNPENEAKLDEIMNAQIVNSETPESNEGTVVEEQPAPETPVAEPEPEVAEEQPNFTIDPEELTKRNFKDPNKFLKSWDEKQALIDRQQKFIEEKLTNQSQDSELLERLRKAEAEIEQYKNATTQAEQQQVQKIDVPESNIGRIKQLQKDLSKIDQYDDNYVSKRSELDGLLLSEIDRINLVNSDFRNQLQTSNQEINLTKNQTAQYLEQQKIDAENRLKKQMFDREMSEMDNFSNTHSEFNYSGGKSTVQVENEYIDWGQKVASLYYGSPIDINQNYKDTLGNIVSGKDYVNYALRVLKDKEPTLLNSCQVAGVSTEPTMDISKYKEVCELCNYRDGERIGSDGRKYVVTRFDTATGQHVPSMMESLEAAYQAKQLQDGTYTKRLQDAWKQGGESMANAINKRDKGAVELDNSVGTSKVDAGLTQSQEKALEVLNSINEAEAQRKALSGDDSDLKRMQEALNTLQLV